MTYRLKRDTTYCVPINKVSMHLKYNIQKYNKLIELFKIVWVRCEKRCIIKDAIVCL